MKNEISITICGIRYDAVDMGREADCNECDLKDICAVSIWSLTELCKEIGKGKGTMVFKINEKQEDMEDNVTLFGNIAHNMVPVVERILNTESSYDLKFLASYSGINLSSIEGKIGEGVIDDELKDMLYNLVHVGMGGYLTATGSTKVNALANQMTDLYARKNRDYGNSFDLSMDKFGLVVAAIRIGDKVNRIQSLVKKGDAEVKDESIADTFMDMACYAIMTLLWLRGKKEVNVKGSIVDKAIDWLIDQSNDGKITLFNHEEFEKNFRKVMEE